MNLHDEESESELSNSSNTDLDKRMLISASVHGGKVELIDL